MSNLFLRLFSKEVLGLHNFIDSFKQTARIATQALRDFNALGIPRRNLRIALAFGIIGGLLEVVEFALIYKLINALLKHEATPALFGPGEHFLEAILPPFFFHGVGLWASLVTCAVIVKLLATYINFQADKFVLEAQRTIMTTLNNDIFARTLTVSFSFFDLYPLRGHTTWTDVSNLIQLKTEKYADSVKHAFNFFIATFTCLLFLAAMAIFSPLVLLLMVVISPLARSLGNNVTEKILKAGQKDRSVTRAPIQRALGVIGAVMLVKTSNMENKEIENFRSGNEDRLEELQESSKIQLLEKPVTEMAKIFSMTAIAVIAPLTPALSSKASFAGTMTGIFLMRLIENQIDQVRICIKNLIQYEKQKTEIGHITGTELSHHYIKQGTHGALSFEREIEMKSLNFEFLPGRSVLKNLSLKIKKGEVTAIVGPTGSGKSSLLKILLRLYNVPDQSFLIDGVDVNTCSVDSVRSLFCVVPQESIWMNGSIRENLLYGLDRKVSEKELREVCAKVEMLETILKLPKGFDTIISGRSIGLSGGQQQCLSIARALLSQSPILVLDEPTSALDAETEYLVQGIIDSVVKEKSIIIVAHRLSTISKAQNVIVLKDGELIESGSITDLLSKQGAFHALWERQGAFWRSHLQPEKKSA